MRTQPSASVDQETAGFAIPPLRDGEVAPATKAVCLGTDPSESHCLLSILLVLVLLIISAFSQLAVV